MCGTFRRRAMDYAAKDIGANVIATGHNLDDILSFSRKSNASSSVKSKRSL